MRTILRWFARLIWRPRAGRETDVMSKPDTPPPADPLKGLMEFKSKLEKPRGAATKEDGAPGTPSADAEAELIRQARREALLRRLEELLALEPILAAHAGLLKKLVGEPETHKGKDKGRS